MYNSIIISSCLFGSVYIFSTSLYLINNALLLENKKLTKKIILLNAFPFIITGSVFIYSFNYSFKFLNNKI
jgi:hypothetical protein